MVSCCFYVAYQQEEMYSSEDEIINVELDMDLKRQENETTMSELTTATESIAMTTNPPTCNTVKTSGLFTRKTTFLSKIE